MEARVEYYYLSGDGSPKGPFALKKMREWHQFYPLQMNLDVMVRCGGEGSFTPLREFAEIISTAEAAAPASAPAAAVAESSSSSVALVPRTALQWFYSVDGSEYGPYSVEQLRLWESSGCVFFSGRRAREEGQAREAAASLMSLPPRMHRAFKLCAHTPRSLSLTSITPRSLSHTSIAAHQHTPITQLLYRLCGGPGAE
jgi:hypothetical protein